MRPAFTILLSLLIAFTASCRKDFDTVLATGSLHFSKDTVYLDTVFSNIGSSTYTLKVYNRQHKAIAVPVISLENGEDSHYRLNVDGLPGKSFENVEIGGRDSLYIFVETTLDYSQLTDPLYIDALVFDHGDTSQKVALVTLVEDAHFLYPSNNAAGLVESIPIGTNSDGEELRIQGFYLEDDTVFTDDKPYVIYGYCAIPENKTLRIEAGTRIHFHENSGLIADKNASLHVEGEIGQPVTFEGDRLEPFFQDNPGQWGTIWLRAGSRDHRIDHALIKNATIGILIDSMYNDAEPTLSLYNSQIYNSSLFGLLGRETHIYGENLVINNSGQSSLACTMGGQYRFVHSTFANYWNHAPRDYPAVLINNYVSYTAGNAQVVETRPLTTADFINCIIEGAKSQELIIDKADTDLDFNYVFKHNLIRFNDPENSYAAIPELNFEDSTHYSNNLLNGQPDFKNPLSNELIIGVNSDAVGQAQASGSSTVPTDILGIYRTPPADIGAYQHIVFEED